MDSTSDDDIELLRQTPGEEGQDSSALAYRDLDPNLNPLDFIKRGSSPGDSIDPGSIHALQTAFSTLQKKHNEEVRKNKELLHANKAMKKALVEARPGNQGQFQSNFQNMEEFVPDTSVHAAGGTSEDESLAESRAKQGYILQLQRELLIANNTIQKGNEEIVRHKNTKEELEREKTHYLRRIDELLSEKEMVKEDLNQTLEENTRKDLEIAQMKNAVQSEQELNHNLRLTYDSLREQIQMDQRNGVQGQTEIQNLKSKLDTAEKELHKSDFQYRELENKLLESLKTVGILEAKCKQYEIEVNINRVQRQEKNEDFDDVDGDVATLERALRLLSSQRTEMEELKQKVGEQQKIITQIQSNGKRLPGKPSYDSSLFRPEVQGSSYNPYQEKHIYGNYPNSGTTQDVLSNHSQLSRRSSDRGDYRGTDKVPKTSPRVNDNILPTGNQNITPMLAMETNPQPKRMEIAATVEHGARTRSPGENYTDSRYINNVRSSSNENTFPRTSVSGNQSSYAQQSPRNIISPVTRPGNSNETYVVESPRIRENITSPNISNEHRLPQTNSQELAFIQAGARPRVPPGGSNYLTPYSDSQEPTSPRLKPQLQQIPDRMTQSEIIVRDNRPSDNPMTRSVLEPLQPLEIPSANNTRQSEYVHAETEGVGRNIPQRKASEHVYQNQYREQYTVPDYENIYISNAQTETKRSLEEHDDTVFVTANPRERNNVSRPVQEVTMEGNVSAVKICPVCNEEFSRLTLDQFQMHVFECFDNCDESPATLQPVAGGAANDDDRNCPMCGDVFPSTISQETYEQHVLGHFGEDPLVERFELLQ